MGGWKTLETVRSLWNEVLQRNDIKNVDEDFFVAGGTSLSAAKLVFKLQAIFTVEMPLSVFAENPTVRRMADCIDRILDDQRSAQNADSVPPASRQLGTI